MVACDIEPSDAIVPKNWYEFVGNSSFPLVMVKVISLWSPKIGFIQILTSKNLLLQMLYAINKVQF